MLFSVFERLFSDEFIVVFPGNRIFWTRQINININKFPGENQRKLLDVPVAARERCPLIGWVESGDSVSPRFPKRKNDKWIHLIRICNQKICLCQTWITRSPTWHVLTKRFDVETFVGRSLSGKRSSTVSCRRSFSSSSLVMSRGVVGGLRSRRVCALLLRVQVFVHIFDFYKIFIDRVALCFSKDSVVGQETGSSASVVLIRDQ